MGWEGEITEEMGEMAKGCNITDLKKKKRLTPKA